MSSLNVTLTLYPNYGISEAKTRFLHPERYSIIHHSTSQGSNGKKIERNFKKNQQTALGQGNVTLTLLFLLFNFDRKSLPTVILADKVIQE